MSEDLNLLLQTAIEAQQKVNDANRRAEEARDVANRAQSAASNAWQHYLKALRELPELPADIRSRLAEKRQAE